MKRKLATIQPIKAILPIPDADRIEALKILGWTIVSQKGLHKEGGRCIYCEIDSVMPAKYFPDLEKYNYRISTVKMRGQVSQGFCIPMYKFLEIVEDQGYQHEILESGEEVLNAPNGDSILLTDGLEVTDLIGVTKWEPPAHLLEGDFCGSFPSHLLSKSDEIRVQAVPEVVDELRGKPYVITLKCDGESAAYVVDFEGFCCCARENKRTDGNNIYWNIARKYDIHGILQANPGYAVQGEICGPGIRSNRLGLKDLELFVFNVVRLEDRKKLGYFEMADWCIKNGLQPVPLVDSGLEFKWTFDELLLLADGKYEGTNNWREGIVIRSRDYNLRSEVLLDDMSFKVISNQYLLKGGD